MHGRCRGYVLGIVVCYQYLRNEGISVGSKRLRQIMRGNGIFHRFHRKNATAITTLKRLLICLKDALTHTVSTRLGAAKLRTFEPMKDGCI